MYSTLMFLSLLSAASMIVSAIFAFGDGILNFVIVLLLEQVLSSDALRHWMFAIDGLDPTDSAQLFRFTTMFLALRALFMTTLFVHVVFRGVIKWPVVWRWIFPPAAVGTLAGCYIMDTYGSANWLRPVIGIVITLFASILLVYRLAHRKESEVEDAMLNDPKYDEEYEDNEETMRRFHLAFFAAALIAGVLGATSTIASPPPVTVVILSKTPKALARPTLLVLFHLIFVVRMIWTLGSGFFFIKASGIDRDADANDVDGNVQRKAAPMFFDVAWREAIVWLVGGAVGLVLGNHVAAAVSNARYLASVNALMMIGGICLTGFVSQIAVSVIAVVLLGLVGATTK